MVVLKDVIKITDEDILNAMTYTLYKTTYKDVIDSNWKEYYDFIDEFQAFIAEGRNHMVSLSIGGYEIGQQDMLSLMCERFNHFKYSRYITDIFLVNEVYDEYFKVTFLNKFVEKEFRRVGKLSEITKFLNELQFPYEWEYKKFFRMGCSY